MRPCASVLGLALCVVLLGCREEPAEQVEVEDTALPDTNPSFTPPEIRRVWDSSRAEVVPETVRVASPTSPPPIDPSHGARPGLSAQVTAAPAVPVPATSPGTVKAPAAKPVSPAPIPVPEAVVSAPTDLVGPGTSGEWTIQVGIHKSEEGARGMIAKLSAKGIPGYVVQAASNAGLSGSYWRVRVGPFMVRSDAQKYGDKVLVPGGYSFWIDRKSNEAPAAGGTP